MLDCDPFAPDRWQSTPDQVVLPRSGAGNQRYQRRLAQRFLKGPIPWPWLQRALVLPGKALAVGLMLWLQSGITRSATVHFCLARAVKEGIPQSTARRAVQALERAGLVKVRRLPGQGLEVTLLEVVAEPNQPSPNGANGREQP